MVANVAVAEGRPDRRLITFRYLNDRLAGSAIFVMIARRMKVSARSCQPVCNRGMVYDVLFLVSANWRFVGCGRRWCQGKQSTSCEDRSMLPSTARPMTTVFWLLFLMIPVILVCLAACSSQHVEWAKPGATEAEFERDWRQCSNLAIGLNPPTFDPRTMTTTPQQQSTLQQRNSCMFSRGWQLQPKQ